MMNKAEALCKRAEEIIEALDEKGIPPDVDTLVAMMEISVDLLKKLSNMSELEARIAIVQTQLEIVKYDLKVSGYGEDKHKDEG